jgi:hypothetical protein
MTRKRQAELEQGLTETDTRKKLFALKSIADQFSYIYRLAANSRKISVEMVSGE